MPKFKSGCSSETEWRFSVLLPGERYRLVHGDCIPHLHEMPAAGSVDFSCFSPPFPSVFSYTDSLSDIGNSENLDGDARLHLSFFYRAMLPVMKPGRVMVVHVTQIHRNKRDGEVGLFDFRGLNIRLAQRAGFTYEYDWLIRRNPQAQAIRTRKWELKFQGLESDRAISRGAMGDYLIKFRAPGDNKVPVQSEGDVSRNNWIDWAEPCWIIREARKEGEGPITLNTAEGRGENDTKHVCPLQLDVIDRLVRLYSNPDEIVFSPFAGIGSELYVALKLGRRAYGCELKDEYYAAAIKNCERALRERKSDSHGLFDEAVA